MASATKKLSFSPSSPDIRKVVEMTDLKERTLEELCEEAQDFQRKADMAALRVVQKRAEEANES